MLALARVKQQPVYTGNRVYQLSSKTCYTLREEAQRTIGVRHLPQNAANALRCEPLVRSYEGKLDSRPAHMRHVEAARHPAKES